MCFYQKSRFIALAENFRKLNGNEKFIMQLLIFLLYSRLVRHVLQTRKFEPIRNALSLAIES